MQDFINLNTAKIYLVVFEIFYNFTENLYPLINVKLKLSHFSHIKLISLTIKMTSFDNSNRFYENRDLPFT